MKHRGGKMANVLIISVFVSLAVYRKLGGEIFLCIYLHIRKRLEAQAAERERQDLFQERTGNLGIVICVQTVQLTRM